MQTMDAILQRAADLLGPWAADPRIAAAAVAVLALLAARLVDWILTRLVLVWTRRTSTDLDDRLAHLLHRPIFLTVALIGLRLSVELLELPAGVERVIVRLFLSVAILVWLGFALGLASLVYETLGRAEGRLSFIEPRTVVLFDNVTKLVLIGGGIYLALLTWGIDVGGLLVGAGVMGIALGLAAKDTLANLFSGLFILADAPYKVGDFVNLDSGERGEVTQIGLRSTRLLTRDDIEVTVPNSVIANAKIVNESGGPWLKERVRVKVGVAYGSDVDQVRAVLQRIAEAHPKVSEEPAPRVRFRAFGNSSLDFELLAWIDEPVLRGQVLDALLTEVYKRFGDDGIEIPYPKRDVYLHHVPAEGGDESAAKSS